MWLWVIPAFAGYGDPIDGHPSARERELFVWADAARVAPSSFTDAYADGDCSWSDFAPDEQTPKPPLRWSPDLGAAADAHTDDMYTNDWFGHSSSDGVPFAERIAPYYPHSFGENLAYGYDTAWRATLRGWMCSEGHRAVLMSGQWTEAGTGVIDVYYTADFGAGSEGPRPIGMGAHVLQLTGDVVFLSDWWSADGGAPDRYEVVVDGVSYRLGRRWGEAGQGIYGVHLWLDEGCHRYHFEAERDGVVTRFPEDGAYGWGACDWDDPDAEWSATRLDATSAGESENDAPIDPSTPLSAAAAEDLDDAIGIRPAGGSCARANGVWGALLLAVGALARRR